MLTIDDSYALATSPLCWVHLAARSYRTGQRYNLTGDRRDWGEYATDTLTQAWEYVSRNQVRCAHVDVEGLADEIARRDAERVDAPKHPLDHTELRRVYWNTYARNKEAPARACATSSEAARHAALSARYECLHGMLIAARLAHSDARFLVEQVRIVGDEVDRLADILDQSGHAWEAA